MGRPELPGYLVLLSSEFWVYRDCLKSEDGEQ